MYFQAGKEEIILDNKIYNLLILCTGNSARSILAEAIVNREGNGRFRGFSAGSHPKGEPNPIGLELLRSLRYDTSTLRSKSWTEFSGQDAPQMDFVITVCDSAAGESCPYWPGHPMVAHWGIPDPADVEGTPAEKLAAFHRAYELLMQRMKALFDIPIDTLSQSELKERLVEIGKLDGATEISLSRANHAGKG